MKKKIPSSRLLMYAALLCIALITVIISISLSSDDNSSADSPTKPDSSAEELTPEEKYAQAVSSVEGAQDLLLTIVSTKSTTFNGETFTENSRQTLSYNNLGTNAMHAQMNQTMTIGNYAISSTEVFMDNTGYFTIGTDRFCADMTAEDYCARYAPAILLNTTLYETVTAVGNTISFTNPVSAEAWIDIGDAELIDASGTAVLGSDFSLKESDYSIVYQRGDVTILETYHVSVTLTKPSIVTPDPSEHTQIECLDAPMMLEKACGYLLSASSVTASSTDTIICDAFGDDRTQTVSVNTHGSDSDFMAKVDISVSLINYSHGGDASQKNQSLLFQDNICFVSGDNQEPIVNSDATAQSVRTYCQDFLVSSVMLPGYISSASISDLGSAYRFIFTGNEELAQIMAQSACQTLYQKPSLAAAYQTSVMECYVTIDKMTGLPIASGIRYNGTYTSGDYPYMLCFQTDQNYQLASQTSYETITNQTVS